MPSSPYREFTLTPSSPCATFDYGADVAGFPAFEVEDLSVPTQIELKYSEQFTGLLEPFSDGPSLFASSLANAFRVETFNVTRPGSFNSKLIQGGSAMAEYAIAHEHHRDNQVGLFPLLSGRG
jgi:hypothetical protein